MSLYLLSKFVPVLMRSTYRVVGQEGRESCTWIQWRGRCLVIGRLQHA